MKFFAKHLVTATICSALAFSLTACGDSKPAADDNLINVKIGLVGDGHEQWEPAVEALKKEGIHLEFVQFGDYTLPNQALADGEIDLNDFQHYAFLNNEIAEKHLDLTVIADTLIAPLGIYSKTLKSLAELKEGDLVALPNDVTNGGRALKLFEAAGLIKVKPEAGFVPNVSDIIENKLKLKFIEVEAGGIPALLPDVAIAAINGGHAVVNGLQPKLDAIFLEDYSNAKDNPYINVIVARTAEKDNPVFQKIIKAYQTPAVVAAIDKLYHGAYIPVWVQAQPAENSVEAQTPVATEQNK